jgi:hypothetical protein
MIDFYPAASESGACWEAFLGDLYKRGLKGNPCEPIAPLLKFSHFLQSMGRSPDALASH